MKSIFRKEKGFGILYDNVWVRGGRRTPFGKLCGTLSKISPTDLGIFAAVAAMKSADVDPVMIDQVIFANIGQSSADTYFLPRHIGLYAGIPVATPAVMVQRICGSGLETLVMGAEQIVLGKASVTLCGGTENMSLAPTSSFGNRMGYALGKPGFVDMLWEALNDTSAVPMGCTAENVGRQYKITHEEADVFAMRSVKLALEAVQSGFFKGEIVPLNSTVFVQQGLKERKISLPKGIKDFDKDEHIRITSLEEMSKLPSVFMKDGIQTAANSSGIVDGAAAMVLAGSPGAANDFAGIRLAGSATCALDPSVMGLGPVPSIKLLLELAGLTIDDIGLFEINEAFAAQYIGCERELGLDRNKCNVNGGSIALGHPLAATGVRLSMTLCREMKRRDVRYGIASACIGGGQGTSLLFENTNYRK